MNRLLIAIPLVVTLMACGSATLPGEVASGERAATPSPSAPPSGWPRTWPDAGYGVLVDLTSNKVSYSVSLVAWDGGVARQMTGLQRSVISTRAGRAIQLPYVSMSKASLYYLDGDSVVRGVRNNSAPPADIDLAVPAGSEAAFAVSPDDAVIAVSVLDFTKSPVRVTLYTDALTGGHKHVIYQSDRNYVWPVAWHAGLLVLAHAYGPYEESVGIAAPARGNPYSAVSYHVVDPSNGNRMVLMGSCTVSGPLSPAGSACIQGGTIDWQGNISDAWSQGDWGSRSSAAALSPDGQWVVAALPDDPTRMGIWYRNGHLVSYLDGPGLHDWAGWIDERHVVIGSEGGAWQPIATNATADSVVYPVAAKGFFAGVFPTNIV